MGFQVKWWRGEWMREGGRRWKDFWGGKKLQQIVPSKFHED